MTQQPMAMSARAPYIPNYHDRRRAQQYVGSGHAQKQQRIPDPPAETKVGAERPPIATIEQRDVDRTHFTASTPGNV
jgi:hypothetical protein